MSDNSRVAHNLPLTVFKAVQSAVVDAGEIVLQCRGRVRNTGKDTYDLDHSVRNISGMAKTDADEMAQELILARMLPFRSVIDVNAEEDTPLTKFFALPSATRAKWTLHMDPIDGTAAYLGGKDDFAVGMALSGHGGIFTHSVILAPARRVTYVCTPSGAHITHNGKRKSFVQRSATPSNVVCEKRLLSASGRRAVIQLGFVLTEPSSAHLDIIGTAMGTRAAFLYGGSNVHDSLVPLPFARALGIAPCDRFGHIITGAHMREKIREGHFVRFHRIPSICYVSPLIPPPIKAALFTILSNSRNLSPEYLERFSKQEHPV
ncbi:MAG TPA: inositol monophosphatase family protein [Candidatus Paceibacterota bacterium]